MLESVEAGELVDSGEIVDSAGSVCHVLQRAVLRDEERGSDGDAERARRSSGAFGSSGAMPFCAL